MPERPLPPPMPPPPILHHWFDGPRCPNQVGLECRCGWWVRHGDEVFLGALAAIALAAVSAMVVGAIIGHP